MRVDQIEIHTGEPEFAYEPIRRLEAKCEATTNFSKAPTIQDANLKLQELASKVGANAVIGVQYDSGMSMTSWRSVKATGLAVKRLSDEMPCPVCAETVKRAAKKCRFCGADLPGQAASIPTTPSATSPSRTAAAQLEPLKANDNKASAAIMMVIAAIVGIFMMIAIANS